MKNSINRREFLEKFAKASALVCVGSCFVACAPGPNFDKLVLNIYSFECGYEKRLSIIAEENRNMYPKSILLNFSQEISSDVLDMVNLYGENGELIDVDKKLEENNKNIRFNFHSPLKYSYKYLIKIDDEIKDTKGRKLENGDDFEFITTHIELSPTCIDTIKIEEVVNIQVEKIHDNNEIIDKFKIDNIKVFDKNYQEINPKTIDFTIIDKKIELVGVEKGIVEFEIFVKTDSGKIYSRKLYTRVKEELDE
jgi:hypothetical protein